MLRCQGTDVILEFAPNRDWFRSKSRFGEWFGHYDIIAWTRTPTTKPATPATIHFNSGAGQNGNRDSSLPVGLAQIRRKSERSRGRRGRAVGTNRRSKEAAGQANLNVPRIEV